MCSCCGVIQFNLTAEVRQNFLFEFATGLIYSRNVITCSQKENMCLIRPTVFDPCPPSSGRPLRCLFNTSVCDVSFTSLLWASACVRLYLSTCHCGDTSAMSHWGTSFIF